MSNLYCFMITHSSIWLDPSLFCENSFVNYINYNTKVGLTGNKESQISVNKGHYTNI